MENIQPAASELLGPEKAPESPLARYGLLALKGIENTPAGMKNAIIEDLNHPWQTVGMVVGAAAFGAMVKTVLPRAGNYGKIAGLAVGALAVYKASEPIVDSIHIAGQAKTMNDIDVAGRLLGDVTGSFVVNTAISASAYRLGQLGAEKFILPSLPRTVPGGPGPDSGPSLPKGDSGPTLQSLAEPKSVGFWSRAVEPRIPGALSVTTATTTSMIFQPRLAGIEKFTPSEPIAWLGEFTGPTEPGKPLSVTVQLKSRSSDAEMDRILKDISLGKRGNMSDQEFNDKFGASKESLEEVRKFAQSYGLKVDEADLRSGRVVLTGTAEQFSEAFRTQLNEFKVNGAQTRERSGAVFVPKTMAKGIEGVFGLDDRPQARPHIGEPAPDPKQGDKAQARSSYRADEVAAAYNFPKGTTGKGQSAAIVELGGGLDMENESAYYKQNGLKVPEINVVKLHGAETTTGRNVRADQEVSLDSQIIGTVAPDSRQTIIFAKNNEQGFIDAIARGTFPEKSEKDHQAMSISWGQPAESMSEQGKRGMDLVLKKAALKGISVFVAAGDDGAADGVRDGKYHVDFPASNPYVTGVGGTILQIKNGKIDSEVSWNDARGVTGGGISADESPDYQKDVKLPSGALSGRGVPDLAGNASYNTGYKIRSRGSDMVSGGTSAVAPLYAALALRLNEGLGDGKTVGFMNPFLYQQGLSGKADFFNDVIKGNNNGYDAARGWDPVTGWGSVDGEKLLKAYKQSGK
jgi:kumamolisin